MQRFHAHGSLLLSGEYVLLNGAKALAIPTGKGQTLHVQTSESKGIQWLAKNHLDQVMFQGDLLNKQADLSFIDRLIQACLDCGKSLPSVSATTTLDFDPTWGWGSSASLIALVAQWFRVDALWLHNLVSQGSGYDVACAMADGPLCFQSGQAEAVDLSHWPLEHIGFIHLGNKQDSQQAVSNYLKNPADPGVIQAISDLTDAMVNARSVNSLRQAMDDHERIMSDHLCMTTAKQLHFPQAAFSVKSLGAWGGDFVMVLTDDPSELNYIASSHTHCHPWSSVAL